MTEALADQHRVVAVDLLGFGRSPKPDGVRYDVDCHVDALTARVPRGSVVVAHSTGAIIALRLAVRDPSAVAGLVLIARQHTPTPTPLGSASATSARSPA